MLTILALALSGVAPATAPQQVAYAPPAAWVLPPPQPTDTATPADAPFRFLYSDQQVHVDASGEQRFAAYRVRILRPEALPLGNVGVIWSPSAGSATVHWLRIIRDGRTIDVLKEQHLQILQREGGLEQNILDGELTATLQTPGLQVGDELEFAFTVAHRDPTIVDRSFGLDQLPPQGAPGVFRYQLSWPKSRTLTVRATRDLPAGAPVEAGGRNAVTYELRDPAGSIVNEGAPARYNVRRLIEFSDFQTWQDVSRRFAPLYEKASSIAPGGALHAEVARIAASSDDPVQRAEAALRLVQDQIRYVYVGLNGGNFRPATADETWQRRFGDCKAKTAVLLGVLRALGIEAEPVLVNPAGDDGSDGRLPSPGIFNHVLVHAKIKDQRYWLDGTRAGDRALRLLPPPNFRWGLPLRTAGSGLESVPAEPLRQPQRIEVIDIDSRQGFDKPAKVTAEHVIRGDEAFGIRNGLAALSAEDAKRALRQYWREQIDWVDEDTVDWRYDERQAVLVMTLLGEGKPGWKGNAEEGHRLNIPGAGFYAPQQRRRPKEQDRTAPWALEFPRFTCYATTIRLPSASPQFAWTLYADPVDRRLAGTEYWRASGMKDNIVRTVMSSRAVVPEITAAEAAKANDAIADFNNNISTVYEEKRSDAPAREAALPFEDGVNWAGSEVPRCAAPPPAG